MIVALVACSLIQFVVQSCLNVQFVVGETSLKLPEERKEVNFAQDRLRQQISNGNIPFKEPERFCSLASHELNYGQGVGLQAVRRRVNTCRITHGLEVNKRKQRGPHCADQGMCVANKSSVEEHALLEGTSEAINALSCHCVDPSRPCHRQTNVQVFYWGTKYEKTVDVGRCTGACKKGKKKTCQAISSKVVNVRGPNGAHCVEKVVKCGCARMCHRVSFHRVFSTVTFDEQTNKNRTLSKVVDVGRCVGECTKKKTGRCIHWVNNPLWHQGSELPQKVCLLSSPSGKEPGKCRSLSFKSRVLFADEGIPQPVNIIKRCKCY